eukprot:446371-Prymnesium_polylepis.1
MATPKGGDRSEGGLVGRGVATPKGGHPSEGGQRERAQGSGSCCWGWGGALRKRVGGERGLQEGTAGP